jgi:hypothetical protein
MSPNEPRRSEQSADHRGGDFLATRRPTVPDRSSRLRLLVANSMPDNAAERADGHARRRDGDPSEWLKPTRGIVLGMVAAVPLWVALIAVGYWLFG